MAFAALPMEAAGPSLVTIVAGARKDRAGACTAVHNHTPSCWRFNACWNFTVVQGDRDETLQPVTPAGTNRMIRSTAHTHTKPRQAQFIAELVRNGGNASAAASPHRNCGGSAGKSTGGLPCLTGELDAGYLDGTCPDGPRLEAVHTSCCVADTARSHDLLDLERNRLWRSPIGRN